MKTINVTTKDSYPIHVMDDFESFKSTLQSVISFIAPTKIVLLTNPTVFKACGAILKKAMKGIHFEVVTIPDGERYKNLATVGRVYQKFVKAGLDRSSLVILLGGGVVGDLGGFAASTYLRGIPFVQIATTLVAQVDSSIGGKLGIDLKEGKNLVGVFRQPKAVISYVPFLKTLPKRELLGGFGEVIKYGVIRDPEIFYLCERDHKKILKPDLNLLGQLVFHSSEIKAWVVSEDELETKGLRYILNFGHTFGHALERLTNYRKFHHGEAVGVGMVLATQISVKKGWCSPAVLERLVAVNKLYHLPTKVDHYPKQKWIDALSVDKKSKSGKINDVFVKTIGDVMVEPMTAKELVEYAL